MNTNKILSIFLLLTLGTAALVPVAGQESEPGAVDTAYEATSLASQTVWENILDNLEAGNQNFRNNPEHPFTDAFDNPTTFDVFAVPSATDPDNWDIEIKGLKLAQVNETFTPDDLLAVTIGYGPSGSTELSGQGVEAEQLNCHVGTIGTAVADFAALKGSDGSDFTLENLECEDSSTTFDSMTFWVHVTVVDAYQAGRVYHFYASNALGTASIPEPTVPFPDGAEPTGAVQPFGSIDVAAVEADDGTITVSGSVQSYNESYPASDDEQHGRGDLSITIGAYESDAGEGILYCRYDDLALATLFSGDFGFSHVVDPTAPECDDQRSDETSTHVHVAMSSDLETEVERQHFYNSAPEAYKPFSAEPIEYLADFNGFETGLIQPGVDGFYKASVALYNSIDTYGEADKTSPFTIILQADCTYLRGAINKTSVSCNAGTSPIDDYENVAEGHKIVIQGNRDVDVVEFNFTQQELIDAGVLGEEAPGTAMHVMIDMPKGTFHYNHFEDKFIEDDAGRGDAPQSGTFTPVFVQTDGFVPGPNDIVGDGFTAHFDFGSEGPVKELDFSTGPVKVDTTSYVRHGDDWIGDEGAQIALVFYYGYYDGMNEPDFATEVIDVRAAGTDGLNEWTISGNDIPDGAFLEGNEIVALAVIKQDDTPLPNDSDGFPSSAYQFAKNELAAGDDSSKNLADILDGFPDGSYDFWSPMTVTHSETEAKTPSEEINDALDGIRGLVCGSIFDAILGNFCPDNDEVNDLNDGYSVYINPIPGQLVPEGEGIDEEINDYEHVTYVPLTGTDTYDFWVYAERLPPSGEVCETETTGETGQSGPFPCRWNKEEDDDRAQEVNFGENQSSFFIYDLESVTNGETPPTGRAGFEPVWACEFGACDNYTENGVVSVPAGDLARQPAGPVVLWAFVDIDGEPRVDGYDAASAYYNIHKAEHEGYFTADALDYTFTPVILEAPEPPANTPPTAVADDDKDADEGTVVTLHGECADTDGSIESCVWSHDTIEITDDGNGWANFTAPEVSEDTTFTFTLNATDDDGAWTTDDTMVTVRQVNKAPTADLSADDEEPTEGETVTLTVACDDVDGNLASCDLTQTGGPSVTLTYDGKENYTFTAPSVDENTALVFNLTAADGDRLEGYDELTVTVHDKETPAITYFADFEGFGVEGAAPVTLTTDDGVFTVNVTLTNDEGISWGVSPDTPVTFIIQQDCGYLYEVGSQADACQSGTTVNDDFSQEYPGVDGGYSVDDSTNATGFVSFSFTQQELMDVGVWNASHPGSVLHFMLNVPSGTLHYNVVADQLYSEGSESMAAQAQDEFFTPVLALGESSGGPDDSAPGTDLNDEYAVMIELPQAETYFREDVGDDYTFPGVNTYDAAFLLEPQDDEYLFQVQVWDYSGEAPARHDLTEATLPGFDLEVFTLSREASQNEGNGARDPVFSYNEDAATTGATITDGACTGCITVHVPADELVLEPDMAFGVWAYVDLDDRFDDVDSASGYGNVFKNQVAEESSFGDALDYIITPVVVHEVPDDGDSEPSPSSLVTLAQDVLCSVIGDSFDGCSDEVTDLNDGWSVFINPINGRIVPTTGQSEIDDFDSDDNPETEDDDFADYEHALALPADANGDYVFWVYADELPSDSEFDEDGMPVRDSARNRVTIGGTQNAAFEIYDLTSVSGLSENGPGFPRQALDPIWECSTGIDKPCSDYTSGSLLTIPASEVNATTPVILFAFIDVDAEQHGTENLGTESASAYYSAAKAEHEGYFTADALDYTFTPVILEAPEPPANTPPTAVADDDKDADEGTVVTLHGECADTDGSIESCVWSHDTIEITDDGNGWANFTAPEVSEDTTFTFTLNATDDDGAWTTDDTMVTVRQVNKAPTADLSADDEEPTEGETVTLTVACDDVDGNLASCDLTQTGGPSVTLTYDGKENYTFTAPSVDENTALVFNLTAADGDRLEGYDELTVTVHDKETPAITYFADFEGFGVEGAAPVTLTTDDGVFTVNVTLTNDEGISWGVSPDTPVTFIIQQDCGYLYEVGSQADACQSGTTVNDDFSQEYPGVDGGYSVDDSTNATGFVSFSFTQQELMDVGVWNASHPGSVLHFMLNVPSGTLHYNVVADQLYSEGSESMAAQAQDEFFTPVLALGESSGGPDDSAPGTDLNDEYAVMIELPQAETYFREDVGDDYTFPGVNTYDAAFLLEPQDDEYLFQVQVWDYSGEAPARHDLTEATLPGFDLEVFTLSREASQNEGNGARDPVFSYNEDAATTGATITDGACTGCITVHVPADELVLEPDMAFGVWAYVDLDDRFDDVDSASGYGNVFKNQVAEESSFGDALDYIITPVVVHEVPDDGDSEPSPSSLVTLAQDVLCSVIGDSFDGCSDEVTDLNDGWSVFINPINGRIVPTTGQSEIDDFDSDDNPETEDDDFADYEHALALPADANGDYVFWVYADELPSDSEFDEDGMPVRDSARNRVTIGGTQNAAFEIYDLTSVSGLSENGPGFPRQALDPIWECSTGIDKPCSDYTSGSLLTIPASEVNATTPVILFAFIDVDAEQHGTENLGTESASAYYSAAKAEHEGYFTADALDYTFTPVILEGYDPQDEPENSAPVFDDSVTDQDVTEGDLVSIHVNASDDDDDIDSYALEATNVTGTNAYSFTKNGTAGGYDFTWQTAAGDAGSYYANFSVTDTNDTTTYANVTITVTEVVNLAPSASAGANQTVDEGSNVTLSGSCSDPDGNLDSCTWNQASGPSVVLNDQGNGQVNFTAPEVQEDTAFVFDLTADDGEFATTDQVTVTVTDIVVPVNHAPVFDAITDPSVTEGDLIEFQVHATDADGDALTYTNDTTAADANITEAATGGYDFSWQTEAGDAGTYYANFTVEDNNGSVVEKSVVITVDVPSDPVYDQPTIAVTGPDSIEVGGQYNLFVEADVDDELGPANITVATDIVGYDFTDHGNGTAEFAWNTTATDAGEYYANLTVADANGVTDSQNVTVIVNGPEDSGSGNSGSSGSSGSGSSRSNDPPAEDQGDSNPDTDSTEVKRDASPDEKRSINNAGVVVADDEDAKFVDEDGDGDIDSFETSSGRVQTAQDVDGLGVLVIVDTETGNLAVVDTTTGEAAPVKAIPETETSVAVATPESRAAVGIEMDEEVVEDLVAVTVPKEEGWIHIVIDDPAPGQEISSLTRSDGLVLDVDQAWRSTDGRVHVIDDPETTYTIGFQSEADAPASSMSMWIVFSVIGVVVLLVAAFGLMYRLREQQYMVDDIE